MMRTTLTLLVAIVLLASCNQYQKTPSGLLYKISKGGSKETLKQGQFIKFNIEYKLNPKDTTLVSSFEHVPGYMMVDTSRPAKYSFLEIITKCAPGDKVQFVMNVDSMKKMGMIEENNPIFHARDLINGRVEILKTFATQQDASADLDKEKALETQREIKEVKEYVTKKGIKTVALPSGVLVEVTNPGDAVKADTGKQAQVLYTGIIMKNGSVFQSNMDKKNPNNAPMPVVVGTGGVIPGMDEALHLFGKGGKGKIFIPATLAYGSTGNPPVIPTYANLIFEIEIADVTTPPAPQPAPATPAPNK
jgi:FKBP-type peptidyl-prolyl cis-trans isomerase